ncbi:sensor histidine kinase [Streptomonospora nanhaiensis]|uniref:histidine kinase n=1 Tax=Streptomonospora nanhaiensis TaxID=1323731 RepID=A0A853BH89_9ACTN|nr:histidine kinase [Streptomonospora nanhaiensis]NYI93991.1 signal transduction histidine kinase [Streptomonospora nanhaiensis]
MRAWRALLRRRELLDRRILGGRIYVGSALWALTAFGFGLLVWGVGGFVHRDGVDPHWLLLTLAASSSLMAFRRTHPGLVLLLSTGVTAVDAVLGPSTMVVFNYGDAFYAVCAWGRRRLAYGTLAAVVVGGVAVTAVMVYLLVIGEIDYPLVVLQMIGVYVLVFGSPVTSGVTVREYRNRMALERERTQQVRRMAELDRRNAIADERGRVARELHDVIANHLSAIAVQSTAALSMREPDPERVRRILTVVRDSSLHGLSEMREMIRVLRDADDTPDLEAVTPRLADADRLYAAAREAGLEVRVERRGTPRPLPGPTDAAAYRVLQESLTNALRYAGPKRVEVEVEFVPRRRGARLRLTARNRVAPAAAGGAGRADPVWAAEHGAGAGLTGMRERVDLLGGVFAAGPAPEDPGEWRVCAEFPLPEDDDAAGPEPAARTAGRVGAAAEDEEAT